MYCINVYIDLYSSIIIFKFILLLYTIYYTLLYCIYHLGVRRGTGTQTWKWMEDDSFIFILGG